MKKILIDIPEILETPRLLLHIPKAGFGEKLHQAILDGYEDYQKWLDWPATPPSVQDAEEDCRKHHAEFILRDNVRYIILDKSSKEVVGRCGFPPFQAHWKIPQFGISYFIRKSKRQLGLATEATHALTLLAFKTLKARKVEIYCDAENQASCKIPEKLNFQLEYTQKGGWPRQDGKLAELKTYSLFNEHPLPSLKVHW